MTLHPRPASPDWPNNVETDHPRGGHITLFSCQEGSDYGFNVPVRNSIPCELDQPGGGPPLKRHPRGDIR